MDQKPTLRDPSFSFVIPSFLFVFIRTPSSLFATIRYHSYLDQFRSCDALVGSQESVEYLDRFFDSNKPDTISQVLALLIEAKELLLNRGSSKYIDDFNNLQEVINSITNKQ